MLAHSQAVKIEFDCKTEENSCIKYSVPKRVTENTKKGKQNSDIDLKEFNIPWQSDKWSESRKATNAVQSNSYDKPCRHDGTALQQNNTSITDKRQ